MDAFLKLVSGDAALSYKFFLFLHYSVGDNYRKCTDFLFNESMYYISSVFVILCLHQVYSDTGQLQCMNEILKSNGELNSRHYIV